MTRCAQSASPDCEWIELRVHTCLAHQCRDGYWKHCSACEDRAAIEVPVYAVEAEQTAAPTPCRGDQGRFRIVTLGQMSCDATTYVVEDEVRVTQGEGGGECEIFAKTRRHEAPRDFV